MDYELTKIRRGEPNSLEMIKGLPFESITNDIKQWVDDGIYDRVEVRDANGKLVHHYPRVMRAG